MKLKEYLKEEGIKQMVFSQKVGVTPYTMRCILSGSRDLHLSLACRIEDLTNGQVKCRDLVNPVYIKKLEKRAKELKDLFK